MLKTEIDGLLLHPRTVRLVELYVANPRQPLLITGPAGAGKSFLARHISARLLDSSEDQLEGHPSFTALNREEKKSEISIDSVREVRRSLALKAPAAGSRRVVMLDEAGSLSHEAQNALLKILEEPPADTYFVMAVASTQQLLPTIASRVQEAPVHPLSKDMAASYFSKDFRATEVEAAWSLSGGNAGLMSAILADDQEHPLKLAVDSAKRFLSAHKYERLLMADELAAKKADLSLLLDALSRTLRALSDNEIKRHGKRSSSLLRSRKLVATLGEQLEQRSNARLVGLELALKLEV